MAAEDDNTRVNVTVWNEVILALEDLCNRRVTSIAGGSISKGESYEELLKDTDSEIESLIGQYLRLLVCSSAILLVGSLKISFLVQNFVHLPMTKHQNTIH